MASQNPEIHTDEIALFSRHPVNVAEDRISWHEVRPSYMSNADYSSRIFQLLVTVHNMLNFLTLNYMSE